MKFLFTFFALLAQALIVQFALAEEEENDFIPRSEAPYFATPHGGPSVLLVENKTEIAIDTVIADVRVKQIYKNTGSDPLEAVYTFPASSNAAVYGLTIKIEDRIIEAKIQEKGKARTVYEEAKQEGKSAALLEQLKPNVFTMNVANILPGELIEVELKYTELLKIENNTYELAYPVGFNSNNPNGKPGTPPQTSINVRLNTAIPAQDITSPSHKIQVQKSDAHQVAITISPENMTDSADFVLHYRLAGSTIQTGIQLYHGADENYFLLQMEPPTRFETATIPNREFIFVIDTSGSMQGFPINVSKTLIVELLRSLRDEEKFNVVFFSGTFNLLSPESLDVTADNIERVVAMLDQLAGSGSTNLLGALEKVNQIPQSENYARTVITISDGYIGVEPEVYDLIEKNLSNTNYFSFGIGESVNRHLMQLIARAGYGDTYIALNKKEARQQGRTMLDTIRYPLLTHIDVDFGEFEAYDVQPIFLPDLFSNKPITITGKWQNSAKDKITVSGINGLGRWQKQLDLKDAALVDSRALEYIWARKEIQQLQDRTYVNSYAQQKNTYKNSIINLSLKHNLLTNFTSFVGVDNISRKAPSATNGYHPIVANGFNIPSLLFGLASPLKSTDDRSQYALHAVGKFHFYRINDEWIDVNHSAAITVINIDFNSAFYKMLTNRFPELLAFNEGDVVYINLNTLTLKLCTTGAPISKDSQVKALEALEHYEIH